MTKNLKKGILVAVLLAAAVPAISACNTFAGIGEDVQRGGAAIEREANQNR